MAEYITGIDGFLEPKIKPRKNQPWLPIVYFKVIIPWNCNIWPRNKSCHTLEESGFGALDIILMWPAAQVIAIMSLWHGPASCSRVILLYCLRFNALTLKECNYQTLTPITPTEFLVKIIHIAHFQEPRTQNQTQQLNQPSNIAKKAFNTISLDIKLRMQY